MLASIEPRQFSPNSIFVQNRTTLLMCCCMDNHRGRGEKVRDLRLSGACKDSFGRMSAKVWALSLRQCRLIFSHSIRHSWTGDVGAHGQREVRAVAFGHRLRVLSRFGNCGCGGGPRARCVPERRKTFVYGRVSSHSRPRVPQVKLNL